MSNTSGSVSVPILNPSLSASIRKDEISSFIVLSKWLVECAENPEEKRLRTLQQTILPKLAFFEALPLAVIQPCIAIAKHAMQDLRKDHKKLLRLLYYLIHVLLGCGRAGTTGPKDPDDTVSASILPPHILKDYWEMFAQPTKDVAQLVANLHVLAGILRAIRLCPSQNKQKSNQERAMFTGKFVELINGVLSSEYQAPRLDRKSIFRLTTRPVMDEEEAKALIQKAALAGLHVSIPSKDQKKLMSKMFNLLKNSPSLDAVSLRHILAMSAESCQKSTSVFVQEIKFRLEATMEIYGPSGYLFPHNEGTPSSSEAPNGSSPPLILTDVFSRKYLAQACGPIVKEMGKKAKGTVFSNVLVLMACGDPNPMVVFEAIKALLGYNPVPSIDPFTKIKPKLNFKVDAGYEANERSSSFIAWQFLMKEEVPSVLKGIEKSTSEEKETLMEKCIERLMEALRQRSHSILTGALRVACELGRCYAYAVSEKPNLKMWYRASALLHPLRDEILHVALNVGRFSSAIQYFSIKALIWLQGKDGGALTPCVVTRIMSDGPLWSGDMVSKILQTLFQRCIVEPSMASYILECVNAVVAGNPMNAVPVDLVDFWFYSVEQSDKSRVLNAALQFLEAPLPPRASVMNCKDLGSVSEACSSWRKLKRTVTLWLGNAVAFLAQDHPWSERSCISLPSPRALSTTDLIATEVTQSPLLMSTISQFIHNLLTGSWETRLAATKALICIAIQCGEPYRIQIYGVLKEWTSTENDLFGLSSLLCGGVALLDKMYSGQFIIDECVEQWGGSFATWPPEMVESVRNRHTQLLDDVLHVCQVPSDLFFPLGAKSRALILGENVLESTPSMSSVFEAPQAQYSDYLRQGSLYIDEDYEGEPVVDYEENAREIPIVDPVERLLRTSERTRSFMDTPSLKDIVAQSPEASYDMDRPFQPNVETTPRTPETDPAEEIAPFEDAYEYQEAEMREITWERNPSIVEDNETHPEYETYSAEVENPFQQEMTNDTSDVQSHPPAEIQQGFPKRAAVLFDFEAEMQGELTVNIGDIIEVISEIEGGWYFASVTNMFGIKSEGIVPCDYVELQEE